MSDYKKLVEELKSMGRACYDCQYYGLDCMRENEVCILADAAAAIEELQSILTEADKKQSYQHDYICELVAEKEELQATIELMKLNMPDFFPDANKVTLPKMEVQDGKD